MRAETRALIETRARGWISPAALMNSTRLPRTAGSTRLGALVPIRRDQGRLGEMVDDVRQIVTEHPWITTWRGVFPLVLVEAGHDDEARQAIDELDDEGFDQIPRDLFWLTTMVVLAEAIAMVGSEDQRTRAFAPERRERRDGRPDECGIVLPSIRGHDRTEPLVASGRDGDEQVLGKLLRLGSCESLGETFESAADDGKRDRSELTKELHEPCARAAVLLLRARVVESMGPADLGGDEKTPTRHVVAGEGPLGDRSDALSPS